MATSSIALAICSLCCKGTRRLESVYHDLDALRNFILNHRKTLKELLELFSFKSASYHSLQMSKLLRIGFF